MVLRVSLVKLRLKTLLNKILPKKKTNPHLSQKTQRPPWWCLKTYSPLLGWSWTVQEPCWTPCWSAVPTWPPTSCDNRPSHTPESKAVQRKQTQQIDIFHSINAVKTTSVYKISNYELRSFGVKPNFRLGFFGGQSLFPLPGLVPPRQLATPHFKTHKLPTLSNEHECVDYLKIAGWKCQLSQSESSKHTWVALEPCVFEVERNTDRTKQIL